MQHLTHRYVLENKLRDLVEILDDALALVEDQPWTSAKDMVVYQALAGAAAFLDELRFKETHPPS
jgi:hypothetical protein